MNLSTMSNRSRVESATLYNNLLCQVEQIDIPAISDLNKHKNVV